MFGLKARWLAGFLFVSPIFHNLAQTLVDRGKSDEVLAIAERAASAAARVLTNRGNLCQPAAGTAAFSAPLTTLPDMPLSWRAAPVSRRHHSLLSVGVKGLL